VPITTDNVSSNLDEGEVYTLCDKRLSVTGRWFSPDRHDIAEILLKMVFSTIKQTNKQTNKQLITV